MAESSGGPKKLLWIMIILVLLSSAGAAAAIYMVLDDREDNPEETTEETAEPQPPVFLTIEPFTVNLADDRHGTRLLYTGITLRVEDEDTRELLEEHMPQVRSRLLSVLSGQEAGELTSSEGKQQLATAINERLSEPFDENQPPLELREVLFTEFIVQ
ncbi:flagellar basal body-associated protein FliL [Halomonas sp. HL-93]|uniref:flagellar basal body-associated protein FliL n=1 Tax=Halomonas sp. HL-93 TaxID=1666906 RepID=UPI0006D9B952|nr:flagellar basal body-associated protein FliL [Halomonas sp. HL-93]KPQ22318.1 MAG: flagellar basal body-associated protein FliL [Halomonas sp. HL-93]SBR52361.1 flagellar FliL protein [Halomonas sp. HL-93]